MGKYVGESRKSGAQLRGIQRAAAKSRQFAEKRIHEEEYKVMGT